MNVTDRQTDGQTDGYTKTARRHGRAMHSIAYQKLMPKVCLRRIALQNSLEILFRVHGAKTVIFIRNKHTQNTLLRCKIGTIQYTT